MEHSNCTSESKGTRWDILETRQHDSWECQLGETLSKIPPVSDRQVLYPRVVLYNGPEIDETGEQIWHEPCQVAKYII